ncbi:MAG: glycosyltransferase family 4 protein [Candidatus Omnitrophica bacterium]|nr:glycosyltransferase family 4 protein [Candidatus Omnitrophota bacterium]
MNIAFLTTEYITEKNFAGGLANYLHRVSLGLAQLGHTIRIFVLTDNEDEIKYKGLIVHRIKYAPFNHALIKKLWKTVNMIRGANALKAAVLKQHDKEKIDIVQAASYKATGYTLAQSGRMPVVTRISSFTPLWREANGLPARLDDILSEKIELGLLRRSQGVYAPCGVLAKHIKKIAPINIEIIRPPFFQDLENKDQGLFEQTVKGKDYLLFYGSLVRLKGIEFILKNLVKILSENEKIYFLFVGKFGDESVIKKHAAPFENRVRYFDAMPRSRLIPFIENAKAIILPSMIDNLPNTCLEAMSLKKIVITTHASGFGDVIEHGVDGFLINFGEDKAFLNIIREVCRMDNNTINAIGEKAGKKIKEMFSEKTNLNAIIDYFQYIINQWNSRRHNARRG